VPKPSLPSQLILWHSAPRSTRGSNKPPDETDSNRVKLTELLRRTLVVNGTKLPSGDVRYSVAIGGKADSAGGSEKRGREVRGLG